MTPSIAPMMTIEELRRMPKVELHRHLECSIRFSTLKELAAKSGVKLAASDSEIKEQLLVARPMTDLGAVLEKFAITQKLLSSEEILSRITFEAIEDAVSEGIRILELRWAPTFVRQGHEYLSFEQMHKAIMAGVKRASGLPIAVGMILIIQRNMSLADAEAVTGFAIEHKNDLVGLDLADNEAGFEPRPFAPLFLRAKKAGLHITVHSGESPGTENNVLDAINLLGAERIGHGLMIHNSQKIMDTVRTLGVPLELCPTSNWLTNAVPSTAQHPFRKLMEAGIMVTINSDDPGVFDIDLVNEYRVLAGEHRFTRAEFDRVNDVAAKASFIPLSAKQKFWPRPIDRK